MKTLSLPSSDTHRYRSQIQCKDSTLGPSFWHYHQHRKPVPCSQLHGLICLDYRIWLNPTSPNQGRKIQPQSSRSRHQPKVKQKICRYNLFPFLWLIRYHQFQPWNSKQKVQRWFPMWENVLSYWEILYQASGFSGWLSGWSLSSTFAQQLMITVRSETVFPEMK